MFKFKTGKTCDMFKMKVGKSGDVQGYQKISKDMSGAKVNALVNEGYQPRKAISIANIKKK